MSDPSISPHPYQSTGPCHFMVCLGLTFLLCACGEGKAEEEPTAAEIDLLDVRDLYEDLVTPSRFHAVTLPKGFSRLRIDSEYFTGSYLTEEEDGTGRVRSLDADDFYEWNSALTFTNGIASV